MKILAYTCNIFFAFQWNSTMGSTTFNDVIDVKYNWGRCFFVSFIFLLVRKIYMWTLSTIPQYTFPVWKCMIRLRICAHCIICHIRCSGINMTPIWHDRIFICFIYVMCFLNRPYILSILDLIYIYIFNT